MNDVVQVSKLMRKRFRKLRKLQRRQRFPTFESLELRRLLVMDLATMNNMLAPFKDGIEGVTVVTHGFQFSETDGDSLMPLASAIRQRADSENGAAKSSWLLDYDVRTEGSQGGFDNDLSAADDGIGNGSYLVGSPSEIVLLFDWAAESNEVSTGWEDAAGDALFNMLVGLNLLSVLPGASNPLYHFIGHSFGTVVTSEAVERLAFFDVPVDQVTYIDPHDFDETGIPVDEYQRLYEVGKPQKNLNGQPLTQGYGATVWNNVAFTDVYYQTRPVPLVPEGRPIPGAYNQLMNAQVDVANSLTPHSAIWSDFYYKTVVDQTATANTGFAFSRVASGIDPRPSTSRQNAVPNFYSPSQNHEHTPIEFLSGNVAPSDRLKIESAKQQPDWSWTSSIINGSFKNPGDEFDLLSIVAGHNLIPGWSHHGGGGAGKVQKQGDNYYLELSATGPSRTHNSFFIDPQAAVLNFDLKIATSHSDDALIVFVGDSEIRRISVSAVSGFKTQSLVIPSEFRRASRTITFRLQPPVNASVESIVQIDNVTLQAGGRTGDIMPVDLASLTPGGGDYSVIGWDVLSANGSGTSAAVTVERNALRKDDHLKIGGETVAYVIYSDRVSNSPGSG